MTSRVLERDAGFSLTELALVLCVSSIVAALAFSAYRTYSVQAEVATAIGGVKRVRHAVEETFKRTGMPPKTLSDLSTPLLNSFDVLADVRVDNGRIELTFSRASDSAIAGQLLYLTPFETVDEHIIWSCGNRLPGAGVNPLGFAGGANVAEHAWTAIEPRFLPPACR